MSTDDDRLVVYVTVPTAEAASLARLLVEGRHAACVNVVAGVRSVYRWQGEVCEDEEALLIAKTSSAKFERLRQAVVNAHPYEVPEVIALPIRAGHGPYLRWIDESVSGS